MKMQVSPLASLSAFYFNPEAIEIEETKDYWCTECRKWVSETTHFENEEGAYELCGEHLHDYKMDEINNKKYQHERISN